MNDEVNEFLIASIVGVFGWFFGGLDGFVKGLLVFATIDYSSGIAADLSCLLGAVKMFETVKKLHAEGKLPDLDYCIRYKTFIHIDHIDCRGRRKSLWEIRA